MLIETDHLLDIDSRHEINISLNERDVSVTGRIVNCIEVTKEDIKKYEIGIEFMEMTEDDRTILADFLNSLDT